MPLETKFFELVFFLQSLRALLVRKVRVVMEVLELGPGDWIHLDWPQQTALFGEVVEFVIEPTHVVGGLALLPPFVEGFHNGFMLYELRSAGTSPSTGESRTLLAIVTITLSGGAVVFLERVLTETLEVIGPVRWNVVKATALALGGSAGRLLASGCEVIMVFELVVAETFGLRTDHLAVLSPLIPPTQVQSILRLLGDGQADWLSDVQLLHFLRRYVHLPKCKV